MQPWWATRVVLFGGRTPLSNESRIFFRVRLAASLPAIPGKPLLWWAAGVAHQALKVAEKPNSQTAGFVRSLRRLPHQAVISKFRSDIMCPIGATLHGAASLVASGNDEDAAMWAGSCVALTIQSAPHPESQAEYSLLRYRHAIGLDCDPTSRSLSRLERRIDKGLAPGVDLERLAGVEGWERGDLDGSLLRAWSLGWTMDELESELGCSVEKISDDPELLGRLDAATRTIGPSLRWTPSDPRVEAAVSGQKKETVADWGGGDSQRRSIESESEVDSLMVLARAMREDDTI